MLTWTQRNLVCIFQTDQILVPTQISVFIEILLGAILKPKLFSQLTIFLESKGLKSTKPSPDHLCSIISKQVEKGLCLLVFQSEAEMTLLSFDSGRCSTCVKDLVVAYDWTPCLLEVVNDLMEGEDSN